VAQAVRHLLCNHRELSSNPCRRRRKKKNLLKGTWSCRTAVDTAAHRQPEQLCPLASQVLPVLTHSATGNEFGSTEYSQKLSVLLFYHLPRERQPNDQGYSQVAVETTLGPHISNVSQALFS
jgi:hypothetical protein